MSVDPRTAHLLNASQPLALMPHVDHDNLWQLRQDFARYLDSPAARDHQSWQEAWNAWTGATPSRPGEIRYTPHRCGQCHGKGFDVRKISRNMARTGSPYTCGECRGSRRGQPTRQTALYTTVPVADEATTTDQEA